mmetsp:Transcript_10229/g.32001  ORF Transcript_10229/g.32001 Transcript_10229/m.32001 type:complete len:255 (-) Transcript_10229:164-928(-)
MVRHHIFRQHGAQKIKGGQDRPEETVREQQPRHPAAHDGLALAPNSGAAFALRMMERHHQLRPQPKEDRPQEQGVIHQPVCIPRGERRAVGSLGGLVVAAAPQHKHWHVGAELHAEEENRTRALRAFAVATRERQETNQPQQALQHRQVPQIGLSLLPRLLQPLPLRVVLSKLAVQRGGGGRAEPCRPERSNEAVAAGHTRHVARGGWRERRLRRQPTGVAQQEVTAARRGSSSLGRRRRTLLRLVTHSIDRPR